MDLKDHDLALMTDDMEVHVAPDRSLVLVDRSPTTNADGEARIRCGPNGLAGTKLDLVHPIKELEDGVLHGFYTGSLSSLPVVLDQFVKERNGVPITIIHVIRRAGSPQQLPLFTDIPYIRSLF